METYKLLEAPRKTVKIIYISETAHLSLQPSGRQTSRGQCCAQKNINKHTRGKAKEGRTAARSHALNKHTTNYSCCLSWLLSATLIWDSCRLGPFCCNGGSVLSVLFLPCAIPGTYPGRNAGAKSYLRHISQRTVMPRHCFLHLKQIPALLKAPCETAGVTRPFRVFAWHL